MFWRIAQRITELVALRGEKERSKWTWLEWVAGVVLLGLLFALLLPVLNFARAVLSDHHIHSQRVATQNTMKQWGLVFKMYANESEGGRWPELAQVSGLWVPALATIYPEYLSDPDLFVSPGHPEYVQLDEAVRKALEGSEPDYETAAKLMSESFAYLGYIAMNESDVATLRNERDEGRLEVEKVQVSTTPGKRVLPLREGAERFLMTDHISGPDDPSRTLQSKVPVLIEIAGWRSKVDGAPYLKEGANVLYMDGHVEFVSHGTFPVVPSVMDILSGIAPDAVLHDSGMESKEAT